MSNHINEILFALADEGVEFILGGGVAAVLHGVERVTDIDLALRMDEANMEKFLAVMSRLALRPRVPVPARDLMSPGAVRRMVEEKHALVFSFIDPDKPLRHVDIFLTKELSFEEMNFDAKAVTIGDRTIRVVSAARLLKIKQSIHPPRDKDIFDIKALEKLLAEET